MQLKKAVCRVLLLGIGWWPAGTVAAQTTAPPTRYLNAQFEPHPGKEGAVYSVETVPTDSLSGVETIYDNQGLMRTRTQFADLHRRQYHGTYEDFYPDSRQLKMLSHYVHGKLEGELLRYFPNGQLQRREQYKDYASLGGECFGPDGKAVPFFPHFVFPQYPGGYPALMQYIGAHTRYPMEALRHEQQDRVLVTFRVDAKGRVKNAKVLYPRYAALDKEALRVVGTLRRWQPGREEGEVAETSFTLPVTFVIK